MLTNIKKYKTIIANFSYLSILQIFNLALPIVTYPFLIRTLGQETYGELVYSQAIVGYFVILINFGFNITATKEISIHRAKSRKVNQIVSSVYQIKFFLFLISVLFLLIFLHISDSTPSNYYLYGLTLWMCVYEFLFPIWYFQGIEKMKYISILTVISRLIFLLLIFLLIKTPQDFLLVPAINGIGAIITCCLAGYILYKNDVRINLQPIRVLKFYLIKSYVMAIAVGANTFKTNFNIIVVKFFFSYSIVAYFDLAMKVVNIGISFLDLISQAIYPKMSKSKDSSFLLKIVKLSLLVSFSMMLFIQIFAGYIVKILGGYNMADAVSLLRVLALILPIYIIGALYGRNCLVIHGHDKYVLRSMLYSSGIYVLVIVVFYLSTQNMLNIYIALAFILSFLYESIYRYMKSKALKLI